MWRCYLRSGLWGERAPSMRAPAPRFTLTSGLLHLTRHLLPQRQSGVVGTRKVNTQREELKKKSTWSRPKSNVSAASSICVLSPSPSERPFRLFCSGFCVVGAHWTCPPLGAESLTGKKSTFDNRCVEFSLIGSVFVPFCHLAAAKKPSASFLSPEWALCR